MEIIIRIFDLIKSNFEFIAWENFYSPKILLIWGLYLLSIHFVLFTATLISHIITQNKVDTSNTLDFVLKATFGLCILSFIGVTLLFLQILHISLVICILVILYLFSVFFKRKILTANILLWKNIYIKNSFIIIVLLILSSASILPPKVYDETSFHLAYIQLWINHGGIFVEPTMRYPLYVFNWHSLQALFLVFKNLEFSHFVTWSTGFLTTLGIVGVLEKTMVNRSIRTIASLSFIFTPIILNLLNTGYNDIPIMLFMLVTAIGAAKILEHNETTPNETLLMISIIWSYFIIFKPTNVVFAPILAAILLFKRKWKYIIILTASTLPFILRNIFLGNDPIPPLFTTIFHIDNPYWTQNELKRVLVDLSKNPEWDWTAIYRFPLELIHIRGESLIRGGALLSYVFVFPFSVVFYKKLIRNKTILTLILFSIVAILLWLYTSYYTRYAYFIPLLVIISAWTIQHFTISIGKKKYSVLVIFISAIIFFFPYKTSITSIKRNFFYAIPTTRDQRTEYIGTDHYMETVKAISNNKINTTNNRVYTIFPYYTFKSFLIENGYYPLGDWFHPGSYHDFINAIKTEKVEEFINKWQINYFLIPVDRDEILDSLLKLTDRKTIFKNNESILIQIK